MPVQAPPADRFRDLMAGWPTGVAVVTGADGARPLGCTVTALASVSADPPLLLVSLAARSRTLAAVERSGRFGICVLSTAQRRLARAFASGEPAARFAGVPHRWTHGVPLLPGAVTGAVCAVRDTIAVADHVLVFGGPLWQAGDPGAEPVIWYRRGPHDLAGRS
ncbi:flavin reductase [Phytohabitans aurantiacus]|jgi:flavin reductase (DIM6/NTAB) family NADH-FMN oxidoreductase RutF|uniref:Flavin reductase n=2 Tax=Phytohabitans aurantiacus TaxID=3016789 RepID=A0ABQ5QQ03_9ACTN|nr:flavin reductase [Phytohabitans aurantiacus]